MEKWFLNQNTQFSLSREILARNLAYYFFFIQKMTLCGRFTRKSTQILSYCSRTYFAWSELSFMYIAQE